MWLYSWWNVIPGKITVQGEEMLEGLPKNYKKEYLDKAIDIAIAAASTSIYTSEGLSKLIESTYNKMIELAEK
jgi:hypothetical protein